MKKQNLSEKAKRTQQRKRLRHANAMKMLRAYRVSVGCKRCGEKHPACLEFHHLDPEDKKYPTLQQMVRGIADTKALLAELIRTTIVLCSNCHKKDHYEHRDGPWASPKDKSALSLQRRLNKKLPRWQVKINESYQQQLEQEGI